MTLQREYHISAPRLDSPIADAELSFDQQFSKDNNEPEYIVEKILKEKMVKGKPMYYVKWVGYAKPDWQPKDIFVDTDGTQTDAFNEYMASRKDRTSQPNTAQTRKHKKDKPWR